MESHDVDMNRGAYHGCASVARHEEHRRVVVDGGFKSTSINECTVESHDVDMNRGANHGYARVARHEEHRRVVVVSGIQENVHEGMYRGVSRCR